MRKNLSDNFEDIYLRSNIVKRDIVNADPKILKSKDFNKICAHLAGRCFVENKEILLSRGFDYPDVLSIAKVFGATYVGAKYNSIDDKKTYNLLMMRYISQRLVRLVAWVSKKIRDDEISSEIFERCMSSESSGEVSLTNEIRFMEEDLLENKDKKERVKLKKTLTEKRNAHQEVRRDQKTLLLSLREKIATNHEELADVLVYYSNSKAVAFDVRKVARKYCDKFGIDYRKEEQV